MSVVLSPRRQDVRGGKGKPTPQVFSSCHAMSPIDQGKLDSLRGGPLTCPIPDNEPDRLFHLHESKLLNNVRDHDPMFDRFTGLVQRMFKARMAFINLVDTDKLVVKSSMGWPAAAPLEQPRKSFCSYVVMSDSPDVFVVEDPTKDARFRQWKMVTTPPYIRFYAGTPLIITTESSQYKIGTLCVLDTVPRTGAFTQEDRMNLLDLGAAVSFLVQERYEQARNHAKEVAEMVLDVMQNVRDPLYSINTITHDMIHNNPQHIQQLLDSDLPPPLNNSVGHDGSHEETLTITSPAMDNLACTVDHLKLAVESNIRFGEFFLERAETKRTTGSGFAMCDALIIVNDAIQTMSRMKVRASFILLGLILPLHLPLPLTKPNLSSTPDYADCCGSQMDPPRSNDRQQGHGLHHCTKSRLLCFVLSHRTIDAGGMDHHPCTR